MSRSGNGVGLVAAAHFANDALTSMLPALLPSLALRLRLEPPEVALIASTFVVSTSLPQPLFGLLADRLGRVRIGASGLMVTALLIASLSLSALRAPVWRADARPSRAFSKQVSGWACWSSSP